MLNNTKDGEYDEKTAQNDYTAPMADSQATRVQDTMAINQQFNQLTVQLEADYNVVVRKTFLEVIEPPVLLPRSRSSSKPPSSARLPASTARPPGVRWQTAAMWRPRSRVSGTCTSTTASSSMATPHNDGA